MVVDTEEASFWRGDPNGGVAQMGVTYVTIVLD